MHPAALILPLILLATAAAEHPVAKVLNHPGPEYAAAARSWQGIPGIERAANGRLWVTWYSGDNGEGDMGNYAMVSTAAADGGPGQAWSAPIVIQGPPETRIGDPVPWIDPQGRLWIFYNQLTAKTATTPLLRATCAIRTDDPTVAEPLWSTPFVVATDGILFGKPVVRADGAWIAPFFVTGSPSWKDAVAGKVTGTLRSTDQGATWAWLGGTSVPKDLLNFSEATLAIRRDGSLWMVLRTTEGLFESQSTDGGATWTDARPMADFGRGPATRACMRRLASGAFILVYHDAPPNAAGAFSRSRLTVWLSDDEGRTWPHRLLLDERSRVSYPDAVEAPDGRIFITYDLGRYQAGEKSILVTTIREADIRAGKVVSADVTARVVANQCFAYGNHSDLRDEAAVAQKLPPKDKLHLYLLIGQSNMAGRGILDPEYAVSRTRILKFSPRNVWASGVEPLHTDKPQIAGVGLGMSFGRTLADADPTVTIGLIPCAVGGTPLSRWEKGADLYEAALARARLAMKDGNLRGILWHQGEADSGQEATAQSYAARLARMIGDLRTDLGAGEVPFVAGELGDFLAPVTKEGTPSFWPVVNAQLATLPTLVSRAAVVDSAGLQPKSDAVHFDTPSLREFGLRYARAIRQLQEGAGR